MFNVLTCTIGGTPISSQITGLISGNTEFNSELGYVNAPTVLAIVSSMMITYSISDIIYGQILLPTKKEKYYLYALLGGTILNIVFSIVFGLYVFPDRPSIGVALGTAVTDLLILIFLVSVSWKWIKGAIFNFNSLKIFGVSVVIFLFTFFIRDPFYGFLISKGLGSVKSMVIELVGIVAIDAIIYLVSLALLKEDLVSSFLRKKETSNAQ